MQLRNQVLKAVVEGDLDAVEAIVSKEPRAVRYLVGLMYRPDEHLRKMGAKGIALASRYHPRVVKKVILRLIWAMNEESCTYLPTAPEVLGAIADENPELLLPVTPDLVQLCKDTSLCQGICDTLRRVASRCPGKVGQGLTASLNSRLRQGGRCVTRSH